jgi:hypothetical protein
VQLSFWALGEGALGGCKEAQELEGDVAMVAVEEQGTVKQ